MDMIEKVARAIKDRIDTEDEAYFRDDGDTLLIDGYVNVTALARAVIEAMREPTEKMRDRYNDPDIVGYGPDGSDHDKVWQAGIDAILSEIAP